MSAELKNLSLFRKEKRRAGYTLIELCIVLVVSGVVMAVAAQAYRVYTKTQGWDTTINNTELAVNALDGFLARYGRYPCPARLNALRTDADYGMEGDCDPVTGATVAVGTCANGICVEQTQRTDLGSPAPRVRRGALPFRILNIPEQKAIDGYDARLQYVVTESMTQANTYNKDNGGISIIDERPLSVINPPDQGHFVVFSTGADRAGGFSKQGQQIIACGTVGLDVENCNTSTTNNMAIYRLARQGAAQGAAHFDDILRFYSSVNTPLWRTVDQNGLDISTMDAADAVGMGMNPGTGNKLEVNGQIKVTDNINTSLICGPLGNDCFEVEKIAGDDPDMQCSDPAQPYVSRIWGGGSVGGVPYYGKVECTAVPSFTCPPGQIMRGISTSGKLTCAAPDANCPIKNTTICDSSSDIALGLLQSVQIPAGTPNQIYQTVPQDLTPSDPNDYKTVETWKCIGGEWLFQSWNGKNCGCVPSTTTYTNTCQNQYGQGVPGTFTGNVTIQNETVCPANTTTATNLGNDCVCTNTTQTRSATCPLGFTGNRTESRNWTCTSTSWPYGSWSAWTETANNCVCQPTTDSQTAPCAAGWTGQIEQHRDLDCATMTWGPWIQDSNTCTCAAGQTETQTVGCSTHPSFGAGWVGNVTQTRSFDCPTSTWSPWVDVSDNCAAGTYNWVPVTTPQGPYSSPLVPTMAWEACTTSGATGGCSQPVSGGYYFYQTCSCQ